MPPRGGGAWNLETTLVWIPGCARELRMQDRVDMMGEELPQSLALAALPMKHIT